MRINLTSQYATLNRLREYLASHADLRKKLEALEKKFEQHDDQFVAVFEAIRQLMDEPDDPPKPRIGFETEQSGPRVAVGPKSKRKLYV